MQLGFNDLEPYTMRVLHTADWHIGQFFHEFERGYEHAAFLGWLNGYLITEKIDVLLVSGDVFDVANPASSSIRLFYTFLNQAVRENPDLQIIVTAGNHDSPSRLETPIPLLESSNIHIIGHVKKDLTGQFDYNQLLIPLKDKSDKVAAWCLAIPFLRMGDYPFIADSSSKYTDGVTRFYQEAYQFAQSKIKADEPVIAMGHLHAKNAENADQDNSERLIMGGVECISAAAFHPDFCYIALGHIHKAQRIGGMEHIRYSGSPIPLSFSEANYKHQVLLFDLTSEGIQHLRSASVPVTTALLRIPAAHKPLHEVLQALDQLENQSEDSDLHLAPYLEVKVLLEGPQPALRHKIETAIQHKYVRLAKIDVGYPNSVKSKALDEQKIEDNLETIQPVDLFRQIYEDKYEVPVPASMLTLFNQAAEEAFQRETT